MSATIDTWTAGLGFVLGFCLIAAWLAIAGTPADAPTPSASIRLGTLASGELEVSPLGKPVLAGTDLTPGAPAETGTARIRNQTPRPLEVAARVSAVQEELERSAWIDLRTPEARLGRGPLSDMHAWSRRSITLAPDETRRIHVRAWIPKDAADGWQASRSDLTLEFRTKVVRRR